MGAYLAVLAVVLVPPGGNAVLVAGAHAVRGWRGALAFTAGDLTANLAQMTLSASVLAAVVAAVPTVFARLRWAGTGVLLVLAVRELRRHRTAHGRGATVGAAPSALWLRGFLVSAVNPVAVLFFAALLPAFIDPARPLAQQLLTLAAGWVLIDGALLLAYAGLGGRLLTRLACGRPQAVAYANAIGLLLAATTVALISPL